MEYNIVGQTNTTNEISRVLDIFKASNGTIRPNFFVTGPSGSGKSFLIQALCETKNLKYYEVNAAQLTKEGVSGNSVTKALSFLRDRSDVPTIVFVDEFDKLLISGNSNDSKAHESTIGVQNEFLKLLESPVTQVFADYGKFETVSIRNVLFVFAGAFNGEPGIDIDRLRELGVKTEFLGRVPLVYSLNKLTLDNLYSILDSSDLLAKYFKLFPNEDHKQIVKDIREYIKTTYEKNELGARMINAIIHKYFINAGVIDKVKAEEDFNSILNFIP